MASEKEKNSGKWSPQPKYNILWWRKVTGKIVSGNQPAIVVDL